MGGIRAISGILIIVGLIIVAGAVGYDDYTVAMGVACPLSVTIIKMLTGIVITTGGVGLMIIGD